jgi:hypothetical protein
VHPRLPGFLADSIHPLFSASRSVCLYPLRAGSTSRSSSQTQPVVTVVRRSHYSTRNAIQGRSSTTLLSLSQFPAVLQLHPPTPHPGLVPLVPFAACCACICTKHQPYPPFHPLRPVNHYSRAAVILVRFGPEAWAQRTAVGVRVRGCGLWLGFFRGSGPRSLQSKL